MISANMETLWEQAPMTAHDLSNSAIPDTDESLGNGYAEDRPDLIGTYMRTAMESFSSASLIVAIQEASEKITDALRE